MAQCLGALIAFAEDPGLSPRTYKVAHNYSKLHFQGIGCSILTSMSTKHIRVHIHICRQNIFKQHTYKIK